MTCIAAWIEKGQVWMGADSAGVSGLNIRARKDEKVFINSSYVIGFTSSFRMGQLLRYKLEIPSCPEGKDHSEFMATDFIDAVRNCLSKGGFAHKEDEVETGGNFLVGISGRLYEICDDFQVAEVHERFMATGCGEYYAIGALAATDHLKMPPRMRLLRALEIAEKYSAGVRRPFVIRHTS